MMASYEPATPRVPPHRVWGSYLTPQGIDDFATVLREVEWGARTPELAGLCGHSEHGPPSLHRNHFMAAVMTEMDEALSRGSLPPGITPEVVAKYLGARSIVEVPGRLHIEGLGPNYFENRTGHMLEASWKARRHELSENRLPIM